MEPKVSEQFRSLIFNAANLCFGMSEGETSFGPGTSARSSSPPPCPLAFRGRGEAWRPRRGNPWKPCSGKDAVPVEGN